MGAGYYKRLCGMVLALVLALALGSQVMGEEIKGEDKRRVVERVRSMQAPFIENRGQVADVRVKYYAKTSGGTVFVTGNGEIVYSFGARRAVPLPLEGRGGLSVKDKGELEVETGPRLKQAGAGLGVVKFTKPVAYQEEDGSRKYIEAAYVVKGDEYWFELGEYGRDRELVIDPFLVSTFVGGAERDFGRSIALDASGDVYVAGYTNSSDFPTTVGAYDRAFNGGYYDAFVVRADAYLLTNSCTPGDPEGDRGHP